MVNASVSWREDGFELRVSAILIVIEIDIEAGPWPPSRRHADENTLLPIRHAKVHRMRHRSTFNERHSRRGMAVE